MSDLTVQCVCVFAYLVDNEVSFKQWSELIASNYDKSNKKTNRCIEHLNKFPNCLIRKERDMYNVIYK